MVQAINDRARAEEQQRLEERVRASGETNIDGVGPLKPTAMTM